MAKPPQTFLSTSGICESLMEITLGTPGPDLFLRIANESRKRKMGGIDCRLDSWTVGKQIDVTSKKLILSHL
jgi:hypothetical protein